MDMDMDMDMDEKFHIHGKPEFWFDAKTRAACTASSIID